MLTEHLVSPDHPTFKSEDGNRHYYLNEWHPIAWPYPMDSDAWCYHSYSDEGEKHSYFTTDLDVINSIRERFKRIKEAKVAAQFAS